MATDPHDREDLLGEATGLPERGQFSIHGIGEIVVGFRHDGSVSWYFDQDPVFQFTANQRLRRVFWEGSKYAVANGKIIQLVKDDSSARMSFIRKPLSDAATEELLQLWERCVAPVKRASSTGQIVWHGSTVAVEALEERIAGWLDRLPETIEIADNS